MIERCDFSSEEEYTQALGYEQNCSPDPQDLYRALLEDLHQAAISLGVEHSISYLRTLLKEGHQ